MAGNILPVLGDEQLSSNRCTVILGCHAVVAAEQLGEVTDILKAHLPGNLADTEVAVAQQLPGSFYPQALSVRLGPQARRYLKAPIQGSRA